MFADLKAKVAGIDRKRVYTAAAALLIAGAAGHFMQRTAGGPQGSAVMSASVPAISAPEILGVPAKRETPETVATAPLPEIVPAEEAVAGVDPDVNIQAEAAGVEAAAGNTGEIVASAPTVTPRPLPKPKIIPETGTVTTALEAAPEVDSAIAEVTRATPDPLLTIADPTPNRDKDSVFASVDGDMDLPSAPMPAPAEPEVDGCAVNVEGTAKPGAMLSIAVSAPCNSGEEVFFEHAGLKFSEQLGPDGSLAVEVPAMIGSARVSLEFADGVEKAVEVAVPDFADFDRIAVIWQGATGLQLHALEGGAGYKDAGHRWADMPGTIEAAVAGTDGFVSVLGSTANGFAADIYTYPAALMRQGAEPEVSIEAQVMENTCGSDIEGWILRTNTGSAPLVEPLTIMVPGCESVGEYLVLKNLPVELKLARR